MLEACSNEIIKEDSGWSPRHWPGKPTSVTSDKLNMPQALRIQSIFMGPHILPFLKHLIFGQHKSDKIGNAFHLKQPSGLGTTKIGRFSIFSIYLMWFNT